MIEYYITNHWVPDDLQGIYFLLSSADVASDYSVEHTSGFCDSYCGYHSAYSLDNWNSSYKFAWAGDATTQCPYECGVQTVSPNNDPGIYLSVVHIMYLRIIIIPMCYCIIYAGVDAMLSVIAHELAETTTDPDINAWFDADHMENAGV